MAAEIAILGAGPVGCVLALLLQRDRQSIALVGRQRAEPASLRPIALSHASRLILERAGAWDGLAPTPIERIHVSQQGGFGRTELRAADAGVPALGYVIDYRDLMAVLRRRIAEAGIGMADERSECALTVHAEGAATEVKEKHYRQEALVSLVTTRPVVSGTAWERFTAEGPLALLPLGGRLCAVWGMSPGRAQALCEAPEAVFLEALQQAIGGRAGDVVAAQERSRVPLALRVRRSRIGERAAFIGNAAQTLHPVAGQGLNLGLRDAWDLAQVLHDAEDPGAASVLQRFAALRRLDAASTVRVTDFLAGAFLGHDPVAGLMRGIGLTALDICLPARRFFARRMIFGASALP
jgi:2-octaprenyl-6-methoxyphenol hydroxylase